MRPLVEVYPVTRTGEGGGESQVEIVNSVYGGTSPSNTFFLMEDLKDADLSELPHNCRLIIT